MKLRDGLYEYSDTDKTALNNALLAMQTCPHCRRDLYPVALFDSVYGCQGGPNKEHPFETWYLPDSEPFSVVQARINEIGGDGPE